jgi:predicted transcriptional regulator
MPKWITVQVDDDINDRLKEQAKKKDLTLAQHIRRVLIRQAKR